MRTFTKLLLASALVLTSACAVTPNGQVVVVPTKTKNTNVIKAAPNCIVYNRPHDNNVRDFNEVLDKTSDYSGDENLRRSAELAGRTTPRTKPLCRPKANIYVKVP